MKSKTLKRAVLAVLLAAVASTGLLAQTPAAPPQTFSTTIYLDYSFFGTNNGYMTNTTANPNLITNKFQFRRAYLTYENKVSDTLSSDSGSMRTIRPFSLAPRGRQTQDAAVLKHSTSIGRPSAQLQPEDRHDRDAGFQER